jgi:hypothetical protein
MFSVDQIIQEQFPVLGNSPPVFATMLSRLLRLILRERDFQLFAQEYPHLQGMDFVLHKVKPAKLQRYMGVRQSGEAA